MKLLIAEDEDSIRNGMEKYIKLHTDRFSRIYLAENGQEALDMILEHQPEIMLLDVQMPVKNGIEVMQEADRMGRLPATIILSGYDEFKYAQQAIRFGAREYLLKPCRSSEILERLRQLADEIEGKEAQPDEINPHYAVDRARTYIADHYTENLSLHQVAEYVGISHGYLSTLFSQHMGCGFIDYLHQIRVEKACAYLEQNYFKTYEIAYKLGFKDEKYFSKVFKKYKGVSPSVYRKEGGGRNERDQT